MTVTAKVLDEATHYLEVTGYAPREIYLPSDIFAALLEEYLNDKTGALVQEDKACTYMRLRVDTYSTLYIHESKWLQPGTLLVSGTPVIAPNA